MKRAIADLCTALRWKLTTLFRANRFFDTPSMVIQFKSRILSYVEHRTSAIYHADSTSLGTVDHQYDRFLAGIGLTRKTALLNFSLAPLNSRRDIALLGVIHRATLGKGPRQITKFFVAENESNHPDGRSNLRRHNRQLKSY